MVHLHQIVTKRKDMCYKMYGKIKESRLLNIEVYKNDDLLYKGKIEDAPDKIKDQNYESVEIVDGWVVYHI